MDVRSSLIGVTLVAAAACSSRSASPPDASHLPDGPPGTAPIEHVLVLNIDGLHGVDLARYLAAAPDSTLARLASLGTRYGEARAPFPSDSFPSVLAEATGGTPRSTGVFYDISYDRTLSPPGSDCSTVGTVVDFSEVADRDSTAIDGGGGLDPAKLPRDPAHGCAPVYPHAYLRVNTTFEVVHEAGGRTAWADKHLSYEILDGPSGAGVDDLFDPEIAAADTRTLAGVTAYDQSKVDGVLHEIDGLDHAGGPAAVPALYGMNFQAVSVQQKIWGYADGAATPIPSVTAAIGAVDAQLGTIVRELVATGQWASTVVIVSGSHGQSPIDPAALDRVATNVVPDLVDSIGAGTLAHATQDTVALLWLAAPARTAEVAQALTANRAAAGLDHVLSGAELVAMFGDPATDARVPDLIGVVKTGTIYTDSHKKVEEHGGMSDDDREVALLVLGGGAGADVEAAPVETRQLAPTILSALGLDPSRLDAVRAEGTAVLPGLSFRH
ncbi:MAG TPA: alkaline phosphatase family protein [Kofleriaceae bacterium]|nr:alkaline phosphatase family protein [Kofleriaceae bacterium]